LCDGVLVLLHDDLSHTDASARLGPRVDSVGEFHPLIENSLDGSTGASPP
jgi:hypothetical protein